METATANPTNETAPAKVAAPRKVKTKGKPKNKSDGKTGPSKPQARILKALSKGKAMDRHQLSKASGVHVNWIAEYVGGTADPVSDLVRGRKKLVPAGFIKQRELDHDGVAVKVYEITASGKKALTSYEKAV